MAELKRNFLGAMMNKDIDERLLKPGEYRDANNMEVSTSEGSDAGTVQTIRGNTKRSIVANSGAYSIPDWATCVGSIAALNTDKVYYFVSAGSQTNVPEAYIRKDYIMEYDPTLKTHKYVFVDIYQVRTTCTFTLSEASPTGNFLHIPSLSTDTIGPLFVNSTGVRVGMKLTSTGGYGLEDDIRVTDIIYSPATVEGVEIKRWKIVLNKALTSFAIPLDASISFWAPERVLWFDKTRLITGINILDDSIYWTDNFSEPKKISISRSIAGTGGVAYLRGAGNGGFDEEGVSPTSSTFLGERDLFHTRLVRGKGTNLSVVTKSNNKKAVWVEEKHVTVIKRGPTQPLELALYKTTVPRFPFGSEVENDMSGYIPELDLFQGAGLAAVGDLLLLDFEGTDKDYRIGDTLRLNTARDENDFVYSDDYALRVRVLANDGDSGPSVDPNINQDTFRAEVLSIRSTLANSDTSFKVVLEQGDSLFEFKFPRFSYRYKFQDGEFSTFAPWSEVAFIPDTYDFSAKQGYNLGMANQLRNMVIKGYHAGEERMMEDVVEIDILYKETNNPTVFVVKTLTPEDPFPVWPTGNQTEGIFPGRGSVEITTDLIHTLVPSNQLLRPWDNVPRRALAQEVSANRLIYGNYVQNYDVPIQPVIHASHVSSSTGTNVASIKTMRDYTVGVVFSDGYGRETPVLFNSTSTNDVKVPKSDSGNRNRLTAFLDQNAAIPDWAEYFSYYVKEPTVEYYNLIMDRYYPAEDGALWVSFPSSERNKVVAEDFLILKKKSGLDKKVEGTNKYKILAIQDGAPDYVKGKRNIMGTIWSDNSDQGSGSSTLQSVSTPIEDQTFFTVKTTVLENELGGITQSGMNSVSGKWFVRFMGDNKRSSFYEIANIAGTASNSDGTGGSDHFKFSLRDKFGEDVAFLTDFTGSPDFTIDSFTVYFYKYEIENLPEFDGRFFVKIPRDSALESALIPTNNDVFVKSSWPVAYINNNGYSNHTGPGNPMPDAPLSLNWATSNSSTELDFTEGSQALRRNLHPTEHPYHRDNGGSFATAYWWDNDEAGLMSQAIKKNPIAALNDENINLFNSDPAEFWKDFADKQMFFIDGATAYSWTSWNPHYLFGSNSAFEEIYASAADAGSQNGFFSNVINNVTEYAPYDWSGNSSANWQVPSGSNYNKNLYTIYGRDAGTNFFPEGTNTFYDYANLLNENPIEPHALWDTSTVNWLDFENGTSQGGTNLNLWANAGETQGFAAASMRPNRGLPSRAIRDSVYTENGISRNASYMDISWTGMGKEGLYEVVADIEATGESGIPHRLADITNLSINGTSMNEAHNFISTLTTPGTRWRFQDDPDGTIYTTKSYSNTEEGYQNTDYWKPGSNRVAGAWGIRNFRNNTSGQVNGSENTLGSLSGLKQMYYYNMRQRWSIAVVPRIGSGLSGYNPIFGTGDPTAEGATSDTPTYSDSNYRRAVHHDGSDGDVIEILDVYNYEEGSNFTPSGAVFETQPRESVDLDLYYQASGLIPLTLDDKTNEEFIPPRSTFELKSGLSNTLTTFTVTEWTGDQKIKFTPKFIPLTNFYGAGSAIESVIFKTRKGDSTTAMLNDSSIVGLGILEVLQGSGYEEFTLHGGEATTTNAYKIHAQTRTLGWNNCWDFSNGVESDRIRDDFNAPQIDNGVKVSSIIETAVKEERRKHGLIWSGIYNSTAGINEINQFIAGEKITKDLNPVYGSIQKLYNRDTRLIMFCEDKVLKGVTNKDALYNADGNPQLVASNKVIGDATTYQGDYGISTNPESFAATPYQIYFTDAVRGQVLRMTDEGIVSISDKGMRNYFADTLASNVWKTLGTYDERKKEYNLSILKKHLPSQIGYNSDTATVSYGELPKGWTSFRSFIPQNGLSINNKYFTFYNGHIWEHYTNDLYNNFYGDSYTSDVTVILNDKPESVKSFGTISYEGSQARVTSFNSEPAQMFNNDYTSTASGASLGLSAAAAVVDGEYFNLTGKTGWYVDNITTDQQTCGNIEFKDKEGKWFGYPSGEATIFSNEDSTNNNLDEKEFTVQGLGTAEISHSDPNLGGQITITVST